MSSPSKDLVVRILTIFLTPVAAAVTAWAAKQGLNLPPAGFVTVGALAGSSVLGLGFHWLQRQPVVQHAEAEIDALVSKIHASLKADPALNIAAHDIEGQLASQTGQLITAIGSAVHAPPSVEDVAQQVVATLIRRPALTTTIIPSDPPSVVTAAVAVPAPAPTVAPAVPETALPAEPAADLVGTGR